MILLGAGGFALLASGVILLLGGRGTPPEVATVGQVDLSQLSPLVVREDSAEGVLALEYRDDILRAEQRPGVTRDESGLQPSDPTDAWSWMRTVSRVTGIPAARFMVKIDDEQALARFRELVMDEFVDYEQSQTTVRNAARSVAANKFAAGHFERVADSTPEASLARSRDETVINHTLLQDDKAVHCLVRVRPEDDDAYAAAIALREAARGVLRKAVEAALLEIPD